MDLLSIVARQMQIPRPVVKDAVTALLILLERFARPEQVARLRRELPLALDLLGEPKGPKPVIVNWISELVAVVAIGPRSIKESLKATGLREAEIVPFVSVVVRELESRVAAEFVAQLVGRVPGLSRLAAMPQSHEADQGPR